MSNHQGSSPQRPCQGVQYGSQNLQINYFASPDTSLFGGGFERLQDIYIDPAILERDLDLIHFTGREWLIERIDNFIRTRSRGYVIIQAEAGVGKSSLAAQLVWTRQWIHHFTHLPGARSPEAARKSMAAQLIARFDLADWAPGGNLPVSANRSDWFDRLLHAAARRRVSQGINEPIVLVVDGLEDAEADAFSSSGLPLGLPASLPEGVFIIATSRFGIDHLLHAVRNPADWHVIDVEGTANLEDMHAFINMITDPISGDLVLARVLRDNNTDLHWFRNVLEERCAGVWIYLRYVLDEIKEGISKPYSVNIMPGDLAGYYSEHIGRWRENAPSSQRDDDWWESVCLPLLGVLAAAREPLTIKDLTSFAQAPREAQVRRFVEEIARPFLNRQEGVGGRAHYELRHASFRDLLSGIVPENRPDLRGQAEMFSGQIAHARANIVSALIPANTTDELKLLSRSRYAARNLAAHAAACGLLDELITGDPRFLLVANPGAVLAHRQALSTQGAKRALAAFEMSLGSWDVLSNAERIDSLAANAARTGAQELVAACARLTQSKWPIKWGVWSGHSHRILRTGQNAVNALTTGRAAGRDVIAAGYRGGAIQVWDAITGDLALNLQTARSASPNALAIGRAGDRDIIAAGCANGTVQTWDAVTGEPGHTISASQNGPVFAVVVGHARGCDLIASGGNSVRLWDAVSGQPFVDSLGSGNAAIYALAIGIIAGREVLVSGNSDSEVAAWDLETDTRIFNTYTRGQLREVLAIAIGKIGEKDVIFADCGETNIFDPKRGSAVKRPDIVFATDFITLASAFGQVGKRVLTVAGSAAGIVWVSDVQSKKELGTYVLTGQAGPVSAVAVGRAGERPVVIAGSYDGTVRVWDIWYTLSGSTRNRYGGVDISPTPTISVGEVGGQDVVISGSRDDIVFIWNALTGDLVRAIPCEDDLRAVVLGHDGQRSLIVTVGRKIKTWDPVSGKAVGEPFTGHLEVGVAAAVGRLGDAEIVAVASANGTIKIWNLANRALTGKSFKYPQRTLMVAVGRAGNRDLLISCGPEVRVWDVITGESISNPLTQQGKAAAVAIGQAGSRDIVVTGARNLCIWDAITGGMISKLRTDNSSLICALKIGQVGTQEVILAGTIDGSLHIWDAVTGNRLAPALTGYGGMVIDVAIGRAGGRDVIVSGASDRTIYLRESRST